MSGRFAGGLLAASLLGPAACAPSVDLVLSQKSPLELRGMQTRLYPIADRNVALRAVIATLQDQGYSIDSVEASAGTVTATKLAQLRLSASTYSRGADETVVRANAIVMMGLQGHQVDEPTFYQQDFFDPLSHTVALNAADAPPDDTIAAPAVKAITPDSIRAAPAPIAKDAQK